MNVRDLVPWARGRALTGGEPFRALQRDINRLFDDVWTGFDMPGLLGRKAGFPTLEVKDDGNEIKVVAELAGMEEKDVDLSIHDGVLTLKGERKSETTSEDGNFSERWYGAFERSIEVGPVEEDKVAAKYENGLLTVTLPKAKPPEDKGRKIPIGKTQH